MSENGYYGQDNIPDIVFLGNCCVIAELIYFGKSQLSHIPQHSFFGENTTLQSHPQLYQEVNKEHSKVHASQGDLLSSYPERRFIV